MRKSSLQLAALGVAAITVASTGVAYAYWTTSGSGTGSATVAASNGDLVNKLAASVPNGIFPGGSVTVTYTAYNSSATDLFVGTVTPTVTTSNAGCLPTWFSVAPLVVNKSIPAGTLSTSPVTLGTNSLSLANAYTTDTTPVAIDQDACKSATVTLTLASN